MCVVRQKVHSGISRRKALYSKASIPSLDREFLTTLHQATQRALFRADRTVGAPHAKKQQLYLIISESEALICLNPPTPEMSRFGKRRMICAAIGCKRRGLTGRISLAKSVLSNEWLSSPSTSAFLLKVKVGPPRPLPLTVVWGVMDFLSTLKCQNDLGSYTQIFHFL